MPSYTPYGFRDSVNVSSGEVSDCVLALDQGMIMAAIANALADDAMQHAFADGPIEAAIRPLIAREEFTAGAHEPADSDRDGSATHLATVPVPGSMEALRRLTRSPRSSASSPPALLVPSEDPELARLDHEPHLGRRRTRARPGREREPDGPLLARPERDPLEAAQLLHGPRHARRHVADVELDDLVAGAVADVLDVDADVETIRRPGYAWRSGAGRESRNRV